MKKTVISIALLAAIGTPVHFYGESIKRSPISQEVDKMVRSQESWIN